MQSGLKNRDYQLDCAFILFGVYFLLHPFVLLAGTLHFPLTYHHFHFVLHKFTIISYFATSFLACFFLINRFIYKKTIIGDISIFLIGAIIFINMFLDYPTKGPSYFFRGIFFLFAISYLVDRIKAQRVYSLAPKKYVGIMVILGVIVSTIVFFEHSLAYSFLRNRLGTYEVAKSSEEHLYFKTLSYSLPQGCLILNPTIRFEYHYKFQYFDCQYSPAKSKNLIPSRITLIEGESINSARLKFEQKMTFEKTTNAGHFISLENINFFCKEDHKDFSFYCLLLKDSDLYEIAYEGELPKKEEISKITNVFEHILEKPEI